MTWLIIGFIVGIVLGLTGAGGGLVSIPLFLYLADAPLKDATIFSLIAVSIGAIISWLPQRDKTHYKSAIGIFLFSFISSYGMSLLKSQISDQVTASLLIILCVGSIFGIWQSKSETLSVKTESGFWIWKLLRIPFMGLLLGAVTTMTGLGGGVILMPMLTSFLKQNLTQAVSTSLMTITFSSLGSLVFQRKLIQMEAPSLQIGTLIIGVLIATLIVRFLSQKIPSEKLIIIRKTLFTSIALWAMVSAMQSL